MFKFSLKNMVRPLIAAVLLLGGMQVKAQIEPIYHPSGVQVSPEKKQERVAFLQETERRARHFLSLLLAELHITQNQPELAMPYYRLVLMKDSDASVWERAMMVAMESGLVADENDLYHQWKKREPNGGIEQKRVHLLRSLARNDMQFVEQNLKEVLEHTHGSARSFIFYSLGKVLDDKSVHLNPQTAQKINQVMWQYPNDAEAMAIAVLFSAVQKKEKETIQAMQQLLKLDFEQTKPTTAATWVWLAHQHSDIYKSMVEKMGAAKLPEIGRLLYIELLSSNNDYVEALQYLEPLLEEYQNVEWYLNAVSWGRHTGQSIEKSSHYLEQAYRYADAQERAKIILMAAIVFASNAELEQAWQWLQRDADELYRFDRAVLRASLATDMQKWSEAQKWLEQAKQYQDDERLVMSEADIERVRWSIISQKNDAVIAERAVSKWLAELSDEDNELRYELLNLRAIIYVDYLNQVEQGIADFKTILAENPNHIGAQNGLGYTLLSIDSADLNEAFNLILEAYRQAPSDEAINDSLGWAYFKKGEIDNALPYLQYAYDRGEDVEAAAHLGEVLWVKGERERALSIFQKAYEADAQHRILQDTIQRLGIINNLKNQENK